MQVPKKTARAWAAEKGIPDWLFAAASMVGMLSAPGWKATSDAWWEARRAEETHAAEWLLLMPPPLPVAGAAGAGAPPAAELPANPWPDTEMTEAEFDAVVDRAR